MPFGLEVVPSGRFSIAFDNAALDWDVGWTALDQAHPSLVTSYTIDRGRQFELDRTDTGRATVEIMDPDGILDPTNSAGPYYGKLEPLLQAALARYDPVADTWHTRFRGFIEDFNYGIHPSQRVTALTITLVDLFEVLAAVEMQPVVFGVLPPAASEGQVFYAGQDLELRIPQILEDSQIPEEFYVVFTGNVRVWDTVYSPGEAALTAIQEAADAEFPGVSNVYVDRFGRLAFHGRLAKFDPVGTHAGASAGAWDFNQWQAGDRAAVHASPSTVAHIRQLGYTRGLSKIINQAMATPVWTATGTPPADSAISGQLVQDTGSIGAYGIRSWSAQNLLTEEGLLDSSTALVETKRFATYYVNNYKNPRNRVTDIGFRSMRPTAVGAAANWELLSKIDISDTFELTVDFPGGGGVSGEDYFVEGIHETCGALTPEYDDVTLTLDLSPRAYFASNPFPTS